MKNIILFCVLILGLVVRAEADVNCGPKESFRACAKRAVLMSSVFKAEITRLEATFVPEEMAAYDLYSMGDAGQLWTRFLVVVPLRSTSDIYFENTITLRVKATSTVPDKKGPQKNKVIEAVELVSI